MVWKLDISDFIWLWSLSDNSWIAGSYLVDVKAKQTPHILILFNTENKVSQKYFDGKIVSKAIANFLCH